ncbi:MAG: DUF2057 domain-containing protein, partial [Lentisphaeraceae bacterium]|nr:DUF2057 domain-containing protein [Lentisphaeraceae bacterium]
MKLAILISLLLFVTSCSTSVVKMTDQYERGAFVEVPYHVKAVEVNGRLIKSSLIYESFIVEIPVGRTEFVYRYHNIFDKNHDDDHEEVESDKMTAVFIAEEAQHYKIVCPNPDKLEDAKKLMPDIKSHLLHVETGNVTEAVRGQIDERFHGLKIMEPYKELKHWW